MRRNIKVNKISTTTVNWNHIINFWNLSKSLTCPHELLKGLVGYSGMPTQPLGVIPSFTNNQPPTHQKANQMISKRPNLRSGKREVIDDDVIEDIKLALSSPPHKDNHRMSHCTSSYMDMFTCWTQPGSSCMWARDSTPCRPYPA